MENKKIEDMTITFNFEAKGLDEIIEKVERLVDLCAKINKPSIHREHLKS